MMLAVGEEEFFTMMMVFTFVILIIGMSIFSKHKQARFKLIERALQAESLDDTTRKQLIDGLTSSGWMSTLQQQLTFLARNGIFVIGWLGIFTGLGMAAWGGADGDEDILGGGLLMSFISFGIVTVPLALRELQARNRA